MISILKEVLLESETVKKDVLVYLEDRLCEKCELEKVVTITEKKVEKKDKSMIVILIIILIAAIILPPFVYCLRHYDLLFIISL